MDYDVLMNYLVPILGIAILSIPICIGIAYLIGRTTQKINIKKGLDKDDTSTPIGKLSLFVMLTLFSIVLAGGAVIFVIGSLLGWETPI